MRGLLTTVGAALMVMGLMPAAAVAAPDLERAIAGSCASQMYLPKGACSCLAARAVSELDPLEQAWLALGATDVAHSSAIAKRMSGAEYSEVDRFMRTVPDACASQATATTR